MARILIVEDNADLAFGLKMNLEVEGHDPTVVPNGTAAIEQIRMGEVDLVVLDLMLPGISGFDVLRMVRAEGFVVPVVVLSGRAEEVDRVTALRMGADDYVTKPFSLLEFLERVKLRLRGPQHAHRSPSGLQMDLARREVVYIGRLIKLTALEFDLLAALIGADGAVLSKEQLLESVWHVRPDLRTRTVEYYVASLRRKLSIAGVTDIIRVVRGRGFALTRAR